MKPIHILLFSLIITALTACGGKGDDDIDYIAEVETALDSSQYDNARKLLDEHFADTMIDNLSASQYARLSIVCMRMRDVSDETDTWAWAQRAGDMYGRAIKADSAQAEEFYAKIPAERVEYVQVMRALYYGPQQHSDMGEQATWDDCDPHADEIDHQH